MTDRINYTNMSTTDKLTLLMDMYLKDADKRKAFIEQMAHFLANDGAIGEPFMAYIQQPDELIPIDIDSSSNSKKPVELAKGSMILVTIGSFWNDSLNKYYRSNNLVDVNGFIAVKIKDILILTQQFLVEVYTINSNGIVISSIEKCQWYNCRPIQIV